MVDAANGFLRVLSTQAFASFLREANLAAAEDQSTMMFHLQERVNTAFALFDDEVKSLQVRSAIAH